MNHILSKFGAYASHLSALSEDSSTKSAYGAKLCGYLKMWLNAKYLLGCAFCIDLLFPCSIFVKVMQEDDLDIHTAFSRLLSTVKELNKLSSTSFESWPTYTATLQKLAVENGET